MRKRAETGRRILAATLANPLTGAGNLLTATVQAAESTENSVWGGGKNEAVEVSRTADLADNGTQEQEAVQSTSDLADSETQADTNTEGTQTVGTDTESQEEQEQSPEELIIEEEASADLGNTQPVCQKALRADPGAAGGPEFPGYGV